MITENIAGLEEEGLILLPNSGKVNGSSSNPVPCNSQGASQPGPWNNGHGV